MSKATQFKATPDGVKTARMLQVEKKIDVSLEEDYLRNYINGGLGQKRLASRWGVSRNLIFGSSRGNRRNWVQMLKLPKKSSDADKNTPSPSLNEGCEICKIVGVPLEGAHWVPARDGGSSKSFNIIKLCPNCHTLLDNAEDQSITSRAREVLLARAAEQLLNSTSSREIKFQKRFLALCKCIIERKNIDLL
jgi:hypothetical protein